MPAPIILESPAIEITALSSPHAAWIGLHSEIYCVRAVLLQFSCSALAELLQHYVATLHE